MKHVLAHQIELNAAVESKDGVRGVVLELVSTPTGVELKVATASGIGTWAVDSNQTILQEIYPSFEVLQ